MQKTEGIVLRRQEVRETSLLLVTFTRSMGKLNGLVKGVRGARAAVPWYLEPLTLQAMVIYERKRSPWALISSCDLLDAFDPIRRDLTRTAYAAYLLDLTDAMTVVGDPHPDLFDLLLQGLRALGGAEDPRSVVRFLELRLLKASGLFPEESAASLSPDARAILQEMLRIRPEAAAQMHLSPSVEGELRLKLLGLLRRALERDLKSHLFLVALGLEGNRPHPQPLPVLAHGS